MLFRSGTRPRGLRLPPRISDLLVVVGVKLHVVTSIWVVVVFCRSCIGENGHRDPDGMSTGGTQQDLRTRVNERTVHMQLDKEDVCMVDLQQHLTSREDTLQLLFILE